MSEVNINYKGSTIASMDASGTKTLQTSGKYCEDDVEVVYTRPSSGGGYVTQDANGYVVLSSTNGVPALISKTITESGTYSASTDGATGYSSVTVNVSGGTLNIKASPSSSDKTTRSVLTFSDIDSAPRQFILNCEFDDYNEIFIDSRAIVSVVFDGTNTVGTVVATLGTAGATFEPMSSSKLSWAYSNSNHTLTFTSTDTKYFNLDYTLYYI